VSIEFFAGEIALATQPAEAELVDRDQRRGAGELIRMDFDRRSRRDIAIDARHAVASIAADDERRRQARGVRELLADLLQKRRQAPARFAATDVRGLRRERYEVGRAVKRKRPVAQDVADMDPCERIVGRPLDTVERASAGLLGLGKLALETVDRGQRDLKQLPRPTAFTDELGDKLARRSSTSAARSRSILLSSSRTGGA